MIEIKIKGLDELVRNLREFGPRLAANGVRAANYAAAATILDAVKQTAPVRTGTLKANLVTYKRHTSPGIAKHSVGVKGVKLTYAQSRANRHLKRAGKKYEANGPAFYAKFLEFGTSKMRPHPFMRPAFERSANDAVAALKARLAKAVAKAAAKQTPT